jgi:hypothetical protein
MKCSSMLRRTQGDPARQLQLLPPLWIPRLRGFLRLRFPEVSSHDNTTDKHVRFQSEASSASSSPVVTALVSNLLPLDRPEYTETMTMPITKHQRIGGVSGSMHANCCASMTSIFGKTGWKRLCPGCYSVRRKFGHGYPYLHPEEYRSLRREAAPLIAGLAEEGFIELDKEQTQNEKNKGDNLTSKKCCKLAERGLELCNATAAKPVHRKTADETLQGLMERVRTVNEDDRFLCRITAVVLYGSYVRGAEPPADVDVAIEVERKIDDFKQFHEACWKHLHGPGRACQRIGYELDFPWTWRLATCTRFEYNCSLNENTAYHRWRPALWPDKRKSFGAAVRCA